MDNFISLFLGIALVGLSGSVASATVSKTDCLQRVKAGLLLRPLSLPQVVMTAANVTSRDVLCLAPLKKQFNRYSNTEDFKIINEVDYSFELHTFGHQRVAVTYDFSPADSTSTAALYSLSKTFEVTDLEHNKKFTLVQSYTYDRGCHPVLASTEQVKFKSLVPGQVEITTVDHEAGLTPETTVVVISNEVARNTALMYRIDSAVDAKKFEMLGKEIEVYTEGMKAFIRLDEIAPRKMLNHKSGLEENLIGMRGTVLDSNRQAFVTSVVYESANKSYRYRATDALGSKTHEQEISEREWFLSSLEESVELRPKIVGFTAKDWDQSSLAFEITSPDPIVQFNNSAEYYSTLSTTIKNGTNVLRVRSFDHVKPKGIFAWDHVNTASDSQFLQGSKYIQLDAVSGIANKIRPRIRGMNRLEAAVYIIDSIQQYLTKFDQESVELGLVTIESTRDILKNKTGVCQHYAALFVAIARRLGIPSRIISGYLVDEKSAGSHAWVEVKLNDSNWWPLEPQSTDTDSLPSRSYIPQAINSFYEAPENNPEAETQLEMDLVRRLTPWHDLTIQKTVARKH